MNKKDLKQIKDIFIDAFEPFANAIQKDFVEASKERKEIGENINDIKSQLWKLERRVFAIEEILTEHGKELRGHTKELQAIKETLISLQQKSKDKIDVKRFVMLEKRVAVLETQIK